MSNNFQLSTLNSHLSFRVWVRCATFNQAPYITATMDGFCMQQTNFPFLCVIVDDDSKDGEQDIIKQYLREHFEEEAPQPPKGGDTDAYHLLLARHKENKNCYFAVFLLKYNHYSIKKSKELYYQDLIVGTDFIALCEGDDYWTDEHKLQKQVDALDANPQATLVYTNFRLIDGEGKPTSRSHINKFPGRSHSGDNLPTLFRYGNYIMTLTTMYRSEVWQSESFINCPYKMDFTLTLSAALMGDFIWIPDQTADYRSLESGMVMSNHAKVKQQTKAIYRYYADLFMSGQRKPLSFFQRIQPTLFILLWALKMKDHQFRKNILSISLLSRLLLPVAFVILKKERLKKRIEKWNKV
ncbi:MAG: hypothetical protein IKO73_02805 [Bacteroidaceae bacterium]|nr:hypothetical protein [Bacteroidaceae bacterium]